MLGQDAQGMVEPSLGVGRLTTLVPVCDSLHEKPPRTASCSRTPSFFGARFLAFDPLVRLWAVGQPARPARHVPGSEDQSSAVLGD